MARDFELPKVYPNLSALLSDDNAQIVDIAGPASFQPEIACKALESGRHLQCPKPFAVRYADARKVVELAEAREVDARRLRWAVCCR